MEGSIFSYPDYAAFRDHNNVFDGLIAGGITASLNSNDQADLANGAAVEQFHARRTHPGLNRLLHY